MADKPQDLAKSFDAYEVIGIITPGVVVALVLVVEWPSFRSILGEKGLSVGDFGLFVLVAFVLGHLVQALGNMIEPAVWLFLGRPTDQVRSPKQTLITQAQRGAVIKAIGVMEKVSVDIAKVDQAYWQAVTTRVSGRLKAAGRSGTIDVANRTYSLSRGLVASLLGCLAWYLMFHRDQPQVIVGLVIASAAAVYRMRRAGIHYARYLYIGFIDLPHTP